MEEKKMTRASWSYRTYWQMMYDWLDKLSTAEIINITKKRGIRINATGIDVAHRAATRIADKALEDGSLPVCYTESEPGVAKDIDDKFEAQGHMSVETYASRLISHLSTLDSKALRMYAGKHNVRCGCANDAVITNKTIVTLVNRYATGSYNDYASEFEGVDDNAEVASVGNKAAYTKVLYEKLKDLTVDELKYIAEINHIKIKDSGKYTAINLAEKMAANRCGFDSTRDSGGHMLEVLVSINVNSDEQLIDLIREIKSKTENNNSIIDVKFRDVPTF